MVSTNARSATGCVRSAIRRGCRPTIWMFAGSGFVRDSAAPSGERYAADLSGSVVGLVTFGDEMLAWPEVMSDQEAVEAARVGGVHRADSA